MSNLAIVCYGDILPLLLCPLLMFCLLWTCLFCWRSTWKICHILIRRMQQQRSSGYLFPFPLKRKITAYRLSVGRLDDYMLFTTTYLLHFFALYLLMFSHHNFCLSLEIYTCTKRDLIAWPHFWFSLTMQSFRKIK